MFPELLAGGSLEVLHSLTGHPIVRKPLQVATMVLGQGQWLQTVGSPNTTLSSVIPKM